MSAKESTQHWIDNLETHFANIWNEKGLPTDSKHPYILTEDSNLELYNPAIQEHILGSTIQFHSPNNPKSSQILALNLFLSVRHLPIKFFQDLFRDTSINQTPIVHFEWIDSENVLKQEGHPSHHDVLLDFGSVKYLVEVKFTEKTFSGCKTSLRSRQCEQNLKQLECPLESNYGTRYISLLQESDSPFLIDKIARDFSSCPFLGGEFYQIMRYLSLCHLKTSDQCRWIPMVLFPRENQIVDNEIQNIGEYLQKKSYLQVLYLNDLIEEISTFNNKTAEWLSNRYLLKGKHHE